MSIFNNLILKTIRYVTKRRNEVARPWIHGTVLDIGCGQAYLSRFIDEGQIYVGIDARENLIQELQQKNSNPNRRFICVNIEKESWLSVLDQYRSFDTITLLAVIEHLKSPERILRQAESMLPNNGTLVLTTSTKGGDIMVKFLQKLCSHKQTNEFPHLCIYNKHSLLALLTSCSLKVDTFKRFELGMNQLTVCSKETGDARTSGLY